MYAFGKTLRRQCDADIAAAVATSAANFIVKANCAVSVNEVSLTCGTLEIDETSYVAKVAEDKLIVKGPMTSEDLKTLVTICDNGSQLEFILGCVCTQDIMEELDGEMFVSKSALFETIVQNEKGADE